MASAVTAPAGLAINALQLLQKAAASLVAAAKRHKSLRTRAETFAEELNNSTTWVEATDAKLSGLPEQERLRDFLLTAEKRIQGLLKQSESSSLWRKMQAVILWAVLDASSAEDLLKELGDELGRRKKDVTHAVADFDKMPMKAFSHHNVPLKFGPENHPLPSKEGISRLYNMLVRQEKKGVVVQVTEGACEIETVGYFAALAEFTRHKNACNVGLPLWEDAKAIVDYYQSAWVCWTQAKDKTEEKLLEDIRSQLGDRQTGVSADISKSMVLGVLNRIQIKHRVLILARDVSDGAMLNMLAELIRGQSQVQLVATTRDLSTLGPSHGFPTAVLEDKVRPHCTMCMSRPFAATYVSNCKSTSIPFASVGKDTVMIDKAEVSLQVHSTLSLSGCLQGFVGFIFNDWFWKRSASMSCQLISMPCLWQRLFLL